MNSLSGKKIKVLVVDDSATMQKFIQQLVASESEVEIVACASNPYEARDLIKLHNPDVLILDIEMPRMDGLTFLENLMRLRPMPVVMNSSLSQRGAYETVRALELGAVDYIGKPQSAELVGTYKVELLKKIKLAASVNVLPHKLKDLPVVDKQNLKGSNHGPVRSLIALGASTGGIEALSTVLKEIPEHSPPILIVQHIPPNFSKAFAARLNEQCKIKICEAENGQKLENSTAYIAPGGLQMALSERSGEYFLAVIDGALVSGHKPSVDNLFASIAKINSLKQGSAAVLTGMGNDGAQGLKFLYNLGYKTAVQNKESSVVWGMPSSALAFEPNHKVLPLNEVAAFLLA